MAEAGGTLPEVSKAEEYSKFIYFRVMVMVKVRVRVQGRANLLALMLTTQLFLCLLQTNHSVIQMVFLRGLTDESEILKFLQHGTLVGLLPVPHPILIRKYQANAGTAIWFRTYMWGVIYLR